MSETSNNHDDHPLKLIYFVEKETNVTSSTYNKCMHIRLLLCFLVIMKICFEMALKDIDYCQSKYHSFFIDSETLTALGN